MRKGTVIHMEKGGGTVHCTGVPERRSSENRWCEKHGYIIDVNACRVRALNRRYCGRCLMRWQQLSLPFPEYV
jgi:hypothetical protein